MAASDDVRKELRRYEIVAWCYDGLNGKIIPWTKEHGGTSDDPSVQAFVLRSDGSVLTRAPDGQVYQPGTFARWAREQADAYDKKYPRTRVPLLRAKVVEAEEGVWRCPALDEALEAETPVLLYLGRDERGDESRKIRSEVKAARRFERSTLDSKKAAAAARGWVLLRLDLGEASHAVYARTLGVEKAPALVVFRPGVQAPEVLPPRTTGAALAYKLKKYAEAD